MAPIDRTTVNEKLAKLRDITSKLEQLRKTPAQEFVEDFRTNGAAMHNLVVGIEVVIDLGNHLLSEVFQIKADSYAAVITKLGETGIIPEPFAKENSDMAKFRNVLIHEYGDVDLGKVYEYLSKAPDVFRQFAQHFDDFLEKQSEELKA